MEKTHLRSAYPVERVSDACLKAIQAEKQECVRALAAISDEHHEREYRQATLYGSTPDYSPEAVIAGLEASGDRRADLAYDIFLHKVYTLYSTVKIAYVVSGGLVYLTPDEFSLIALFYSETEALDDGK